MLNVIWSVLIGMGLGALLTAVTYFGIDLDFRYSEEYKEMFRKPIVLFLIWIFLSFAFSLLTLMILSI